MTRERNNKKSIRKEIYVVAVLFMFVFIAMAVYLGLFVKDGSRDFIIPTIPDFQYLMMMLQEALSSRLMAM